MNFCVRRIAVPAAVLIALTGSAFAHTGHGDTSGFVHGFMHPLGGLDHVLVMAAVGVYAAMIGGRALWLMPLTFVGMMALGGAMGASGIVDPFVEVGIAMSVIVLGLAVALRVNLPTITAIALIGLFAIFHGHAHGAEMPQDVSGYTYAAGFMLATVLVHGAGIGLGLLAGRLAARGGWRVAQAAGGAMALAGVAILMGVH